MVKIETKSLLLRRFTLDDAQSLYDLAKDPEIGYMAGWPTHTSVENSQQIIQAVFDNENTFAIILKETGVLIGMVGLKPCYDKPISTDIEIGFWLGRQFWGKGYMKEAVDKIVQYCKEERFIDNIWCSYWEKNERSKRFQEKFGFVYENTIENEYNDLLNEYRTIILNVLPKEEN